MAHSPGVYIQLRRLKFPGGLGAGPCYYGSVLHVISVDQERQRVKQELRC